MYKKYGNKMMCFSPPVMLATFLIEFGFAFYVLWRYKLNTVTRLVAVILTLLGVFQLTEYMICGGLGLGHVEWARLGYVAITILPILGVHLVLSIAKVKMRPLLLVAYGTAAAYVVYFATAGSAVIGKMCTTNYAVFQVHGWGALTYAAYYYSWMLIALGLAVYYAGRKPAVEGVMRWVMIGYISFIVPSTLANLMDPATLAGIPSIMCGFAVLLAFILVWRVMPLAKVPSVRTFVATVKQRQA